MADPAKRRATYEDLLAVPRPLLAEIIHGELVTHPRPATLHALAASTLTAEVVGAFQRGRGGPGGWFIVAEPEIHLGADILVPDLGGWRRERMPQYPDTAAFQLAPDWACEVLSPSTRSWDVTEKRAIYAREEVRHLWFVDPRARTLEVFRLEPQGWVVAGSWRDDARVRAEPFDAIELELGALWSG
ncbi:MAG TPA: Uma2 family endonuclease [Polyangiaceae bacterium]|nr:Uma2 family endonuclease [Polyangiaceae bacterium]